MAIVTTALTKEQVEAIVVQALNEMEQDMIDASVNACTSRCSPLFSNDTTLERKQLRKMLKAIKRIKQFVGCLTAY